MSGTVAYRERIALPANAVVQVSLLDVSRADAEAEVLGEESIKAAGGQVPLPFAISYNPTAIDPRLSYAIRAMIPVDGQLLFSSTTARPVIMRGDPSVVELVVQRF